MQTTELYLQVRNVETNQTMFKNTSIELDSLKQMGLKPNEVMYII